MLGREYGGIEVCPATGLQFDVNSGTVQSAPSIPTHQLPNMGRDPSAQESPSPSLRAKVAGEAGTVRRSVQEVGL